LQGALTTSKHDQLEKEGITKFGLLPWDMEEMSEEIPFSSDNLAIEQDAWANPNAARPHWPEPRQGWHGPSDVRDRA